MVTPNTIDSAEHGILWSPAIPQELNYCDGDGDADTGNHAKCSNADKTHNRQPKFPLLNAKDATQVSEFEQPNGRCDYNRGQRAAGQIL